MSRVREYVFVGVTIVALILLKVAISTLIFWALWNYALPMVWTSAPHLDYWHAMGVMFLLNLIGSAFSSNSNTTINTSVR